MKWDAGLIRLEMTLVWQTSRLVTAHVSTTLQRPEVEEYSVFLFEFSRNTQSWQCWHFWHFCIAYVVNSKINAVKRIETGASYDPL